MRAPTRAPRAHAARRALHPIASRLRRRYHSFQLIEEVPAAELPAHRGHLYAIFPHGVVPYVAKSNQRRCVATPHRAPNVVRYGIMLLWMEMLRQGRAFGGLAASVLFRVPLLRQMLALMGNAPGAPAAHRTREPRHS